MASPLRAALFLTTLAACATQPAPHASPADRGDDDAAAANDFCVAETASDDGARLEATYGLARALERSGYPLASVAATFEILAAGADHPRFPDAVEIATRLGMERDDQALISRRLDGVYFPANVSVLSRMSPVVVQDFHILLGRWAVAKGELGEARAFLLTVHADHRSAPIAQRALRELDGDDPIATFRAQRAASLERWRKDLNAEAARAQTAPSSACLVKRTAALHASLAEGLAEMSSP